MQLIAIPPCAQQWIGDDHHIAAHPLHALEIPEWIAVVVARDEEDLAQVGLPVAVRDRREQVDAALIDGAVVAAAGLRDPRLVRQI